LLPSFEKTFPSQKENIQLLGKTKLSGFKISENEKLECLSDAEHSKFQ